ncbi:MAG TPA: GNAT family protein [Sphingobacteriaceae bacterium]
MLLTADMISRDDLPSRVDWINDPRVNEFMYFKLPVTLQGTMKWYDKVIRNYDRYDLAFRDENGTPVGMSGITAINASFHNGEFYIFINPEMQGRGAGKAITAWMLEYGFSTLGLAKIYLYVDGDNLHAVRLYESIGFVREGNLRQHRYKNGKYHDKLVFGMLKHEWLSGHKYKSGSDSCTVITRADMMRSA